MALAQEELPPSPIESKGDEKEAKNLLREDVDTLQREQDFIPEDKSVPIKLRQVIEQGLRENPSERSRAFERSKLELNWSDSFESFWLPKVALTLNTDNHRIDRLATKDSNGSNQVGTTKTAAGSLGLDFGNYTLFNWGRDYLEYLNTKALFERNKERLAEKRRQLKFNLISQFFNVARTKQLKRIKKEQLRSTSFIYRLSKEKLSTGKIGRQDFYQIRGEFLRAQGEYQLIQQENTLAEEKLANYLGDQLSTRYSLSEQLKFKGLILTEEEALKEAINYSPTYLNAQLELDNAERTYQKTLKDNLPLPKFTVDLGTYTHGFNRDGTISQFETSSGSSNVELVASINMTWTLFGSGGLFNNRANKRSYADKRIAEIGYLNAKREVELRVRMLFRELRYLENQVTVANARFQNAQKTFDIVVDNLLAGKTNFTDYKIALDNFISSQTENENAKFQHLAKKLELADLMGMEDFPGENFELLAESEN